MIRRPPRSTLFRYATLFRSFRHERIVATLTAVDGFSIFIVCVLIAMFLAFLAIGRWYPGSGADVLDWKPTRSDRKSTRLNSSHANISYAVFCLKKKKGHAQRSFCTLAFTKRVQLLSSAFPYCAHRMPLRIPGMPPLPAPGISLADFTTSLAAQT